MSITELRSAHARVKDPVCCNKTQNRQINNFFFLRVFVGRERGQMKRRKGGRGEIKLSGLPAFALSFLLS